MFLEKGYDEDSGKKDGTIYETQPLPRDDLLVLSCSLLFCNIESKHYHLYHLSIAVDKNIETDLFQLEIVNRYCSSVRTMV